MKAALLNYVESQASRFRQYAGLSDSEAVNLKSLLLKLNVLTLYRPMSDSFSGMSLKGNGQRFMLINSNQPKCRQHFTIAHELYHLFMEDNPIPHRCQEEGKKSESEQCADAFALMFLMSADGVRQMIPENEIKQGKVSLATALRIGHYFGTSHSAVLNRLSDLNLISRRERESLAGISVKRVSREYGYDISLYKSGNEGLVIGDFGEKARKLYESDKISEGHYLELLHKIGIDECED
ncbi:MAG: ImmA/IrrE family metallo-endopeptidase [Muribaculaceae bacterium]|nr:ImmA/IrrE family metallo-endopeptidase [Muribaculaceae bacterium]